MIDFLTKLTQLKKTGSWGKVFIPLKSEFHDQISKLEVELRSSLNLKRK